MVTPFMLSFQELIRYFLSHVIKDQDKKKLLRVIRKAGGNSDEREISAILRCVPRHDLRKISRDSVPISRRVHFFRKERRNLNAAPARHWR